MVDDGYLEAGYQYVIIDDCWSSHERDSDGKLQADPERFPNGIKSLADYIHDKGLKFGIYADYGTKTCAGYPGSLAYLETDANTFAAWGVDYLKLDGCNSDLDGQEIGYRQMGQYLNATGRSIVYSCSWPAYHEPAGHLPNYTSLAETCNLWRNWNDIDDSWAVTTKIISWFATNQNRLAPFAGPGHWNDPDMLIIGNYGLSYEQSKTQMALWAIMAAPLIMSVDLNTIEAKFRNILLNRDAIRVNQDALGRQGRLINATKYKIDIWSREILPATAENEFYSYALAFVSKRVDGFPLRFKVSLAALNLTNPTGYAITEVFTSNGRHQPIIVRIKDDIVVRVKPSGVVFLIAEPIDNTIRQNDKVVTIQH